MYGYIYLTTNTVTGKIYIGQKKSDTFLGDKYLGSGVVLLQSINKHGKSAFTVQLLECVDTLDQLNEREIYWISYYHATDPTVGYNLSDGGGVPKLSGEHNPFYGKHHTAESRAKMRDAQHARPAESWKHSEETKQRIGQALKGRRCAWKHKLSTNAKINPNYGMKGKHLDAITRQHISEQAKERWSDDSFKQSRKEQNIQQWQTDQYRRSHVAGARKHAAGRKYKQQQCPTCGRFIGLNNYTRHVASHTTLRKPQRKRTSHWEVAAIKHVLSNNHVDTPVYALYVPAYTDKQLGDTIELRVRLAQRDNVTEILNTCCENIQILPYETYDYIMSSGLSTLQNQVTSVKIIRIRNM